VARWRGSYFANMDLGGQPALVRDDNAIQFNWVLGSPGPGIPADRFSARWTRAVDLAPGVYRFTVTVDDGVRIWAGDRLIIDQWHVNQSATFTADVSHAGGNLPVRVEYFEQQGAALISLSINATSAQPPSPSPVPPSTLPPNAATVVNARYLNVRSSPSSGDNVIGVALGGQTVTMLGRNGGWIKVRLPNNQVGWVGSSYLSSPTPFLTLPVLAS
jgi:hypothetical protein